MEICFGERIGREAPTPEGLAEHLERTRKWLSAFGILDGDRVASLLADSADETTARIALGAFPAARLVPLPVFGWREQYFAWYREIQAKLVLLHPGPHPAREAARELGIRVANVMRHFDAGIFTLEAADVPGPRARMRSPGLPLVLIASTAAFRRLSARLDPDHPVIGITPPSLEHLPPPHTIEHIAADCVRALRRYRPRGPYALAGWKAEGLVALEMARLLEEEGESVAFVAMLDASGLVSPPSGVVRRAVSRLLRRKPMSSCASLAEALRRYHPHPWCGRIIHVAPSGGADSSGGWFEWNRIAPHGLTSHEAPPEMLAETNVETVAAILASELSRSPAQ